MNAVTLPLSAPPGRCGGFTLIELLTTVTVLVVSLALAAPALSTFVRSNRLNATQSELVSALMLARSEAGRLGARVGVEAKLAVASGGFGGGWRVFVDANSNGAYDGGEAVLRDAPDRGNDVKVSTVSNVRAVMFNPNGFLTPASLVTFNLCGPVGVHKGYRVLLEPVGLSDTTEVTTCP